MGIDGKLYPYALRWRHNGLDSVSNHQPHDCLLNRLFKRRSKKTSKLCVTGLWAENHRGPVNSPHKWPVTWKMFPFDDVIMDYRHHRAQSSKPQAPLSPSNWSALYEVSARQSWAEYSSRPKTDSRHQGWTIKDFSVLSEMCSICEQPLYGIMLMISHTNKWCVLSSDQNLQYFSKSIWKIPSASGQSYRPFTSCRTCLSWQWILTGPKRVEWLWVNDFSHNEYHIWKAWPSTCWHVGNRLPKYEVPVFTAQTRNHTRKCKSKSKSKKMLFIVGTL